MPTLVRFTTRPEAYLTTLRNAIRDLSTPGVVGNTTLFLTALQNALGGLERAGGLAGLGLSAVRTLWDYKRGTTGTAGTVARAVRIMALISSARIIPQTAIPSSREAASLRWAFAQALRLEINDSPPQLAEYLIRLGALVSRYLTDREVRAPQVLLHIPLGNIDALNLAYQQYNSIERVFEIIARNTLANPSFIPLGGVEVLSS